MLRAAQPSATWMRITDALQCVASARTCSRIASSYAECSRGTRMRLYTISAPGQKLRDQPHVQRGDEECHEVGQRTKRRRVHELAHLQAIRREANEREHGERQLQAEHDLTHDQQLRRSVLTI